jgi:thiamine-phosphate pyrophosphorylase
MPPKLPKPTLYLITSGETTRETNPHSPEFKRLLTLVRAAADAGINLIQLREKSLSARSLYELAARAAEISRGSETRVLVNDRADIARAADCSGVHLTTRSLDSSVVRRTFGPDFLIGVSTHCVEEARQAQAGGADFAVFGPVFATPSKLPYGPALGIEELARAARSLPSFPLLAVGGITRENAPQVLNAGARGLAAIRLFSEPENLKGVVRGLAG